MKGFKTLEELEKKYPVGYCYHKHTSSVTFYALTPQDLKIEKIKHPDSKIEYVGEDRGFSIYKRYDTYEYCIEGYIFNGKEWFPAINTWDGWDIIDEIIEEEL